MEPLVSSENELFTYCNWPYTEYVACVDVFYIFWLNNAIEYEVFMIK